MFYFFFAGCIFRCYFKCSHTFTRTTQHSHAHTSSQYWPILSRMCILTNFIFINRLLTLKLWFYRSVIFGEKYLPHSGIVKIIFVWMWLTFRFLLLSLLALSALSCFEFFRTFTFLSKFEMAIGSCKTTDTHFIDIWPLVTNLFLVETKPLIKYWENTYFIWSWFSSSAIFLILWGQNEREKMCVSFTICQHMNWILNSIFNEKNKLWWKCLYRTLNHIIQRNISICNELIIYIIWIRNQTRNAAILI